jgi:DNA polymerase-3 subunit alpha
MELSVEASVISEALEQELAPVEEAPRALQVSEGPGHSYPSGEEWDGDSPPPPEPPPDWELTEFADQSLGAMAVAVFEKAEAERLASLPAAEPSPEPLQAAAAEPPDGATVLPASTISTPIEAVSSPQLPLVASLSPAASQPELPQRAEGELAPATLPPFLVSPLSTPSGETIQMVTVVLRSTGDKTRDVLRLRRIHGTIMSYPGRDRFAFRVYERNRFYLLEFPNFTTGVCPELISRLGLLVGHENLTVEPITFQ